MDGAGILDPLAHRVLARYPYTFTVAVDDAQREVAYRLRYQSVVASGWVAPTSMPDGLEYDEYDADAVHVVGWLDGEPACTGRLVFPPGPLPTEQACGITVAPAGQVVDVGRMAVGSAHAGHEHAAFMALLCRLYLEMREHGYEVACGMMSARVRLVLRRLGLMLETLADDRDYWGELRGPVRFALTVNALSLFELWAPEDERGVDATEAERIGQPDAGC
jgi:hypothetical protein